MAADKSPAGIQFSKERSELLLRYARLIRVLADGSSSGDHAAGYFDVQRFLDIAQYRMGRPYPKPRPLPPAVVAAIEQRDAVTSDFLQATFDEMSATLTLDEIARSPAWLDATEAARRWANEPAAPYNLSKLPRVVRRPWVHRYRADITAFCNRWRLRAPWAESALIWNQFLSVGVKTILPFDAIIGGAPIMSEAVRIIAPLPGRTPQDVDRDFRRIEAAHFSVTIDANSDSPVRVRLPFERAAMAQLEVDHDLAVVLIEWNGDTLISRQTGTSVSLIDYVCDEVGLRLGRQLRARERRALSAAIRPQGRAARQQFLVAGFARTSRGDARRHARWVALRLLDPEANTYSSITGRQSKSDPGAVYLACRAFATMADLHLP